MDDLLSKVAQPRTIDDLIQCAEREIGFRCRVYANFVRKKSMTETTANEEIARMRDIRDLLKAVKAAAADRVGAKPMGWGETVLAALDLAKG